MVQKKGVVAKNKKVAKKPKNVEVKEIVKKVAKKKEVKETKSTKTETKKVETKEKVKQVKNKVVKKKSHISTKPEVKKNVVKKSKSKKPEVEPKPVATKKKPVRKKVAKKKAVKKYSSLMFHDEMFHYDKKKPKLTEHIDDVQNSIINNLSEYMKNDNMDIELLSLKMGFDCHRIFDGTIPISIPFLVKLQEVLGVWMRIEFGPVRIMESRK